MFEIIAYVTLAVLYVGAFSVIVWQQGVIARLCREQRGEIERILVLQRSESLEQYAAVEAKRARDRHEEQRVEVEEGHVLSDEPVAQRREGVLDKLWRRPPPIRAEEPRE